MSDSGAEQPQRRSRSMWVRVDRFMRLTHLYTGLFLVPWMLVYASSAFLINHGPTVREWLDIQPMKLQQLREVDFAARDSFPQDWDEQAIAILDEVDLSGAHRVLVGQSNAKVLKINRICGRGNYLVIWHRDRRKISVHQQQPVSAVWFINFLHFKGGYGLDHPAHKAWAVIVDLVALSLAFWVISGVYLWIRRPKRLTGGIFFAAGTLLFVILVLALCQ